MSGYQIFSGSSNQALSDRIGEYLSKPLGRMILKVDDDGEIMPEVIENVSRQEVFLIQSIGTCNKRSINDYFVELLFMINVMKQSSVVGINIVIPYFGYFKQKRKEASNISTPAKLLANILRDTGVQHVITLDSKSKVNDLFDCPVENLFARQVLLDAIRDRIISKRKAGQEVVIVSPDKNGLKLAEGYAKRLSTGLAIVNLRLSLTAKKEKMELLGDVKDKVVVILKDIINSAVSLCDVATFLKEQGAKEVHACVVHPVFSGKSVKLINDSVVKSVVVTDTIPLTDKAKKCPKIHQESIAKILAEGIQRVYRGDSLKSLY